MMALFNRHSVRLLLFKCYKLNRRNKMSSFQKPVLEVDKERKWNLNELKLKLDNNPDVFGTLTRSMELEKEVDSLPAEEGDVEIRTTYGRDGRRRLLVKDYAGMIKDYVKEKRLLDAIDVFQVKMLKEDNVKPQNYFYNLLIDACAKAGYSEKAFKLYNQMKKRGLKVGGTTYTSLFNACALSPVRGDGLKRAIALRELIQEKAVTLNQTNYHAMIKAFGWCGDLETSFSLVDEMVEKRIPVTADTFGFLIQACISDKKVGFRHALVVWHKMLRHRISPKLHNYNLMLRCARDCQIGDEGAAKELLAAVVSQATTGAIDAGQRKLIESGRFNKTTRSTENTSLAPVAPNLLARTSDFSNVKEIGDVSTPQHRLMLMGGSSGFLEEMLANDVIPDIKTVTQILDLLPPSGRAEVEITDFMKKHKIRMDISFCNNLIKRRNMRGDYLASFEVLKLIALRKLKPDLITYGTLAVACRTVEEGKQLLKNMTEAGYRINVEIAGGLVNAGCHTLTPGLISLAIEGLVADECLPNTRLITAIDDFINTVHIAMKDENADLSCNGKLNSDEFEYEFGKFEAKYKKWRQSVEVDDRDLRHPWRQFKKPAAKVVLEKS